ncbi:aromatic-ring-hydroxylating dioxygenase subunit beta [Immundisolibacter sp.]|uniref:aromatic-ring-hydroxylating dioxygenase subunit beta n=1 Tax=Immundisolibacter sp. TaxID=1934948 RepID=UPI0019BC269E|nr:aromatic-ring-hydroxylating dioxygenase subunit beta [Immundisolibacter sp.]MBC7162330.1 aromatic-ring-hydroxylating dioxygenase subunit beta [Immundisolibacter sp.]MEA3220701.1 p-cumate 2,3-dioxygenase system, small oxygenase component [Immundisolibacter sp.]
MALLTRADVEDFLYHEAALLDDWKTMEWAELFTEDGEYLVPPMDIPDADKAEALFIINDDHHRLVQRAKRLTRRTAHVEFPHSKVRHTIHNVRILEQDEAGLTVASNQVVYRAKRQNLDTFVCHTIHKLVRTADGLRIRSKRVMLDIDGLRPHGMISAIL